MIDFYEIILRDELAPLGWTYCIAQSNANRNFFTEKGKLEAIADMRAKKIALLNAVHQCYPEFVNKSKEFSRITSERGHRLTVMKVVRN